jgi:CRISPR-associated protein Cas1
MTDRVLDISEEPARLSVRYGQLVIDLDARPETTVPLIDLAVLVVSHPRASYTNAVLAELTAAGGAFVACDSRHQPAAMLLPLAGHFLQTQRFATQAAAPLPVRKRLWQQIVRAKIRAQGRLLKELRGVDRGIPMLEKRVKSGDPENVEAQASRRYWTTLFNNPDFRRDRDAEDQNRFLNYGYAILRAIVARAICAAGLHPSLGLHHHNQYDTFCLADDLMEPFRPIVDGAIARLVEERGADAAMNHDTKKVILQSLTGRFNFEGESRTLFDIITRVASSLAAVFMGERNDLLLPEI